VRSPSLKYAIIILPFVEILKAHKRKGAAMDRLQENQAARLSEEFVAQIVKEAVEQLPFTAEEYQWLKSWT
jgi:hypothetical protein